MSSIERRTARPCRFRDINDPEKVPLVVYEEEMCVEVSWESLFASLVVTTVPKNSCCEQRELGLCPRKFNENVDSQLAVGRVHKTHS